MKIPFDIKFRPQIESGEYKVFAHEHNEQEVRIVCWDNKGEYPIVALIDNEPKKFDKQGRVSGGNRGGEFSLFIVTPEPELSEFENSIFKLLRQYKECDIPLTPENIKAEASMLWQDFEKYFFIIYGKEGEGDSALRSFYYRGLADGKAEVLKDLPKWRVSNAMRSTLPITMYGDNGMILYKDGYEISISDLEKLPKED